MRSHLSRFIAVLSLSAVSLAVACSSGPGAADVCRAQCDGIANCGYRTDAQNTVCYNGCSQHQEVYDQQDTALEAMCGNSETIRREQLNCYESSACGASSSAYLETITRCASTQQAGGCTKP